MPLVIPCSAARTGPPVRARVECLLKIAIVPSSNAQGWRVAAGWDHEQEFDAPFSLTAYAICAKV